MTTFRQMTALMRPLTERHPDLVMVGPRFLALRPVHHILRGVFVDRTSWKTGFRPFWGVRYLFRPCEDFPMSARVGRKGGWEIDAEGIDEIFRGMVETDLLPWMRTVTLATYVADVLDHDYHKAAILPHDRVFLHAALGEFEAARAIWDEWRPRWEPHRHNPDFFYGGPCNQLMAIHEPLMAGDRAAIAAQFHAWEAESVATLKIGHIWERTSFPIESGA